MASTTGSPSGGAPGAIRTRNKNAASIAKRACDQCKFRKIKVFHLLGPSVTPNPGSGRPAANTGANPSDSVACRNPAKPARRWVLIVHSSSRRRSAVQRASKSKSCHDRADADADAPEGPALTIFIVACRKSDSSKLISSLEIPRKLRSPNKNLSNIMSRMSRTRLWNPAGPCPYRGHPGQVLMAKSRCQWMEQLC
jgi:hypothetical protein